MGQSAGTRAFGAMPDGKTIEQAEIGNKNGMRARLISLGATLQSLTLPDGCDVVLGYGDVAGYLTKPFYCGAIVGRFANRIAGGAFALDGERHQLVLSDGPNTLHGGTDGFDKVVWRFADIGPAQATLAYLSPDGEQGFPGALDVRVTFKLTDDNALDISYVATTTKPTIVNLSHHSYFNLAGSGSGKNVLDQTLMIAAEKYTPVDQTLIPTGEMREVAGTAFDFRDPQAIGARIGDTDEQLRLGGGYDHNFALRGGRKDEPRLAARLEHPGSGRRMDVLTTEPGLQFYAGQGVGGGAVSKDGFVYGKHEGLCLEPQLFPDAPNQPAFQSARLAPGETYRQRSVYRFRVE